MAPPPSCPGLRAVPLPAKHADSVELQPGEDVTTWLNTLLLRMDGRLCRLERRVSRLGKVHVGAALVQTLAWAAVTAYALSRGQPPPQTPAALPAVAQAEGVP